MVLAEADHVRRFELTSKQRRGPLQIIAQPPLTLSSSHQTFIQGKTEAG